MHYIRILRPPTLWSGRTSREGPQMSLVLIISTDLQDSLLCPDEPVELEAVLYPAAPTQEPASRPDAPRESRSTDAVKLPPVRPQDAMIWRSGTRLLKMDVQCPSTIGTACINGGMLCIRTKDPKFSAHAMERIWTEQSRGLIVPVFVELRVDSPEDTMALRRFQLPDRNAVGKSTWLEVEEELGESMARHVWDGGIYTTAMFSALCLDFPNDLQESLGSLAALFSEGRDSLNVVEIGCGVGMLGVGLATALALSSRSLRDLHLRASILMTDLPDAQARAMANISRFTRRKEHGLGGGGGTADITVDYEDLDWEDGRRGVFGPKTSSRAWDLVMLSDCTYNTDTLEALGFTLRKLYDVSVEKGGREPGPHVGPVILIATKCRHSSERQMFKLISDAGFKRHESLLSPIPHLGSSPASLELYTFIRKAS